MIKNVDDIKILDVHWITQGNIPGTIGIVITKNGVGKIKARIGTGLGARGSDNGEARDIRRIATWGGKLHARTAVQIVKSLIADVTTEELDGLIKARTDYLGVKTIEVNEEEDRS